MQEAHACLGRLIDRILLRRSAPRWLLLEGQSYPRNLPEELTLNLVFQYLDPVSLAKFSCANSTTSQFVRTEFEDRKTHIEVPESIRRNPYQIRDFLLRYLKKERNGKVGNNLNVTCIDLSEAHVSARLIAFIVEHFPKIQIFDLSNTNVTNFMVDLLRPDQQSGEGGLPDLKELALGNCRLINNDVLAFIPLGLTSLDLRNTRVTSRGIIDRKEILSKLTGLNLSENQYIDDLVLQSIPDGVVYLSIAHTLVTQQGLIENLGRLQSLEILIATGVRELTDGAIRDISPKIRVLLAGGTGLTDDGIRSLRDAGKLDHLVVLNLANNANITDRVVPLIPSHIEYLGLARTKITDTAVGEMARFSRLQKLVLSFNRNIQGARVHELSNSLQEISIEDTSISKRTVQKLKKGRRDLTVVGEPSFFSLRRSLPWR